MEMQALVLRTLYNNRGWKDKCVSPFNDPLCWRCQDARKKIAQGKSIDLVFTPPNVDDVGGKECSGKCWEQKFAKDNNFKWGSKKQYGVRSGERVFLVFEKKNHNTKKIEYRIWGSTIVSQVNIEQQADPTSNYKYWLRLKEFEALPPEKWSQPLSDIELIGSQWKQGAYRYIYDEAQVAFLEKLVSGAPMKEVGNKSNFVSLAVKTKDELLSPNIEQKVQEIAKSQGRTRDDIIKQAVFEWLKRQE